MDTAYPKKKSPPPDSGLERSHATRPKKTTGKPTRAHPSYATFGIVAANWITNIDKMAIAESANPAIHRVFKLLIVN